MAIKIEMLRCFSVVAQTGNLGDAATRLGRTQSAISMTLKQLEEHLGQRLFETDRKNRLTPLGEEIFALAQQQLRRFDETIKTMETTARAPQGLLRIASIPSVAGLIFPNAIENLTQRHPGIRVELRDTDTAQVVDALIRGRADIGVASGTHSLNGIEQRTLFQDSFGLVAAPNHPLTRTKQPPTLDEILANRFINNNLCTLINAPDLQTLFTSAQVTVHNTYSLIAMVRTGNWITILPETVVQSVPDELVFKPIAGLVQKREVSLLIKESSRQYLLANDLADIVEQRAIMMQPKPRGTDG